MQSKESPKGNIADEIEVEQVQVGRSATEIKSNLEESGEKRDGFMFLQFAGGDRSEILKMHQYKDSLYHGTTNKDSGSERNAGPEIASIAKSPSQSKTTPESRSGSRGTRPFVTRRESENSGQQLMADNIVLRSQHKTSSSTERGVHLQPGTNSPHPPRPIHLSSFGMEARAIASELPHDTQANFTLFPSLLSGKGNSHVSSVEKSYYSEGDFLNALDEKRMGNHKPAMVRHKLIESLVEDKRVSRGSEDSLGNENEQQDDLLPNFRTANFADEKSRGISTLFPVFENQQEDQDSFRASFEGSKARKSHRSGDEDGKSLLAVTHTRRAVSHFREINRATNHVQFSLDYSVEPQDMRKAKDLFNDFVDNFSKGDSESNLRTLTRLERCLLYTSPSPRDS
eukprot:TRINITY_DN22839_c0_g1_i1.p1 TRINITY_DN22839_c0_g1~~TRINITY_DN22839_c0_g1_i1.p1  ORF type:complete len:398 (+),score=55.48 TRINITY_DN22839_c0_g1_i1:136-1329(+)